tara:strand:+ start:30705 stop:31796 length:1092 start_codon:yes stop_codon:yes gene_type:complete
MAFLDKKQNVYDIKLTSHGKKLISLGKFDPVYYAFFDDDVIYDMRYTTDDFVEDQNTTETRIKSDTPTLGALYNFTRVEDKDRKIFPGEVNKASEDSPDPENQEDSFFEYDHDREVGILKNYILQEPLGSSQVGVEYVPSWDIKTYIGEISSSVNQLYSKRFPTINIPQIELECKFITVAKHSPVLEEDPSSLIGINNALRMIGEEEILAFEDGSYFDIERGEILLEISEENVAYEGENFEAEIFLVEDKGSLSEEWSSLFYPPDLNERSAFYASYVNSDDRQGIKYIMPPAELELSNFLDISFDEEIPEEVICNTKAMEQYKSKTIFSDLKVNCQNIETFVDKEQVPNIYYEEYGDDSGEIC